MAVRRRLTATGRRSIYRPVAAVLVVALILLSGALWLASGQLGSEIRARFDGRRWSLPAIVYARPRELYPGLALSQTEFEKELGLAGYRRLAKVEGPGSYVMAPGLVRLVSRDFSYPSGVEPGRAMNVFFAGGKVADLTDEAGRNLPLARLDPARIGSFHPLIHEDRLLLTRREIPQLLIDTLLVVEDRNFYSHFGVAPAALLRALIANLRAGRTVQGGSTLTQQLVKNLFLSSERTWSRKFQEALMALLLERYVSKEEILVTYLNEVFLGQDDNRAIHGFGLASQFYFRSELADLRPDQLALLVGLVKGPSAYDPRRKAEDCRERRDLVLSIMRERGLIGEDSYRVALARPLLESEVQKNGFNRFPAFLQLVRQQLAGEYREEDLKNTGLRILTTLDPQVQLEAEHRLGEQLLRLGKKRQDENLEGAVVVTRRETAEVLALVGGRDPLLPGFNRALQAKRQIGSLIKPVVYLTALQKGYELTEPLEDSHLQLASEGGAPWRPQNYDHREHGTVPLYHALAHSYNLATVRLGMSLGLDQVTATLGALGYSGTVALYPSLLLGAIEMTPFEICQIYQTIAAGGFFTALRAIDSVMDSQGVLLTRHGLAVAQRLDGEPVFLLTHALQRVASEGTAAELRASPLRHHHIAGKTGTTDDLRDSWFVGFSGDHLGVVWVGRDDNRGTGLTGASGALRVWRSIIEAIATSPLQPQAPDSISWVPASPQGVANAAPATDNLLPIRAAALSKAPVATDREVESSLLDTIGGWFNSWK